MTGETCPHSWNRIALGLRDSRYPGRPESQNSGSPGRPAKYCYYYFSSARGARGAFRLRAMVALRGTDGVILGVVVPPVLPLSSDRGEDGAPAG